MDRNPISRNSLLRQQSVASSSAGPAQASVTEDDNSLFRTHRYDGKPSRQEKTFMKKASNLIDKTTYPLRKKIDQEKAILNKTEKILDNWIEQNNNEIYSPSYNTAKERILTCMRNNSRELDLSGLDLANLPTNIFKHLTHLQTINLSNNRFTNLNRLQNLPPRLRNLDLSNNQLKSVNGLSLPMVEQLNLRHNQLENVHGLTLPTVKNLDLSNNQLENMNGLSLPRVNNLNLSHNRLTNMNINRSDVPRINTLNLSHNRLTNLNLRQFTTLVELNLSSNQLTNLRGIQGSYVGLRVLNASHNQISNLNEVQYLYDLTELNLSHNQLTNLESRNNYGITINGLNSIHGLRTLNLSHNQLTNLNELSLPHLSNLDLSHNQLTNVNTLNLRNLIGHNQPTNVNNGLNLPGLITLDLSNNRLTDLDGLNLRHLRTLNIGHNQLPITNNQLLDESIYRRLPNINRENLNLDGNRLLTTEELNILLSNPTLLSSKITNIFKEAGLDPIPTLTQSWDTLQNIEGFKAFINRIDEIADISSREATVETKKTAYQELAKIILQMDTNHKIRKQCLVIATEFSENDCGDAIHYNFLRMQLIANTLDHNNNSLHTLYENQKKLMAFNFVINLANQKIEWLRTPAGGNINNPDKLEVGLAYLKSCSDLLGIKISDMLFENFSHVKDNDKTTARELLNLHVEQENNTYESMINNNKEINKRYKNAFDSIDKKYDDEFDKIHNKYLDKMNDLTGDTLEATKTEYEQALLPINEKVMKEKITFLKKMMEIENLTNSISNDKLKIEVNNALSRTVDNTPWNALNHIQAELNDEIAALNKKQENNHQLTKDRDTFKKCIEGKYDWNKTHFRVGFSNEKNINVYTEREFPKNQENIKHALYNDNFAISDEELAKEMQNNAELLENNKHNLTIVNQIVEKLQDTYKDFKLE